MRDLRDKMIWQRELSALIDDLEADWRAGRTGFEDGNLSLTDPKVTTFVYGYQTFSGQRGEHRVSITIAQFPHGVTSRLSVNDHLEILCLTAKQEYKGFVSLRSLTWYDTLLSKIADSRRTSTDNTTTDNSYFTEARTNLDRELVRSPEFNRIIDHLPEMTSLSIRDSGISVSIPIKDKSQLNSKYISNTWKLMFQMIALYRD